MTMFVLRGSRGTGDRIQCFPCVKEVFHSLAAGFTLKSGLMYCPGRPWTHNSPVSPSWIARITSLWHQACKKKCFLLDWSKNVKYFILFNSQLKWKRRIFFSKMLLKVMFSF